MSEVSSTHQGSLPSGEGDADCAVQGAAGAFVNPPAEEMGWVVSARAGDRGAFAKLYERYARAVHSVLLGMVSPQEAGDMLQEVFLSALRSVHTLEKPERLAGWLCTIARNRARDMYKSRIPRTALDETPELIDESSRMDHVDDVEQAQAVLGVIRSLPEAYRETLCMRLVEGMSGPEIALRSGMQPGSVRVNLHRGMKLLRKRLEDLGIQEATQ